MVQKKSGDTSGCDTNGATCEQVKGSGSNQYPGPGWTGSASTFTSEQCDPADTKNSSSTKLTTNKLCNLANNTNYSDYNANSDISCSTSCTLINTDQCARCGDGDVGSGETCDIASNGDIMTASGNYGRKCNNDSWSTSQSTYWIVPANGQYKITVYGAQGGTGRGVSGGVGCNGAKVWGTFDLTKGETLYIRVGAQGANGADKYGGNGGGGSAVKKGGTQNGKDGTLMLVAGGGGGGGWEAGDSKCAGGQASQYSSTSAGINTSYSEPALGTNGVPGDDSSTGGLGWESGFYFTGGNGGWKCEGCSCTDYGYGGGGGGYTGGSGAWHNDYGGNGGGSYISGSSSGWTGGEHAGAGKVEITQIKYKNCNSSCDGFSDTTCQ